MLTCAHAESWTQALPGWKYQFPADHAVHPDFKTEWWYFTGNLHDESGREYGYELTFFREGILPPGSAALAITPRSRFVQSDFKFAHFALTDVGKGTFRCTQRISRGAFGEAGFSSALTPGTRLAWIDDWNLTPQPDGAWRITARADGFAIDLRLATGKLPVIEGVDGVSQKSAGPGNASHYYSFTRMAVSGTLDAGSGPQPVRGDSWFDHEWASNQLASDEIGWNWFSFQFDNGTELMLYAMRRRDGSIDPASSGTFIDANGATTHLERAQFDLRPTATWRSARTGAVYPVAWQVRVPSRQLDLTVTPRVRDQELALPPISYWEGAIEAVGTQAGKPLRGRGYLELTGYANSLPGL
jgi:predicted secreted hydrolase